MTVLCLFLLIAKGLAASAVEHVYGQCVSLGDKTRIMHTAAGGRVMVTFAAVGGNPHNQVA